MQRQSLGSPVSKLHSHGGGAKGDTLIVEDQKLIKHNPSSSSSINYSDEQDHDQAFKSSRFSFSSPSLPKPEKFVHVIPVLTFICFLILYLFSHSPSQSDLAQFHVIKRFPKHLDSVEIEGDVDKLMEPKKGDILAIQSFRNLKEIEKSSPLKSRPPRKLADF